MELLADGALTDAMPGWAKQLLDYGVMGLFILLAIIALVKYGPKLIAAHLSFVESAKSINEINCTVNQENRNVNKSIGDSLKVLTESAVTSNDPKGDPKFEGHIFSTVKTNKALRLLAQAMVLETNNTEARSLIQKAIDVLVAN